MEYLIVNEKEVFYLTWHNLLGIFEHIMFLNLGYQVVEKLLIDITISSIYGGFG